MAALKMRAVVITKHGDASVLEVLEVEKPPRPTADRVLVRVRAAALNRADVLQRMGRYPAPRGASQNIPGLEFAGEVEAVGDEVRERRVSERVFGITAGGAQSEYVVVPENTLALVPENLDWAQAASVPEAFVTAHDALFTQAGLKMGERVLIHAAGSGVGLAAVQLAKASGAFVCGTSRTIEKLEQARDYGLDESIVIKDEPQVFADAVREWTSGAGVDVVLDLVGGSYFAANMDALANRGRMMLVGTTGGARVQFDFGIVMRKRLRLTGTVLRARSGEEKARAMRLFAAQIVPLLVSGIVRPVIDKIYSMKDVRAAHERMESNENFGKIVLTID